MSERLKLIREELGLTQVQMAGVLGIKQGSYAGIESGRYTVSSQVQKALEMAFRVNIGYLLDGNGEKFSDTSWAQRVAAEIRDGKSGTLLHIVQDHDGTKVRTLKRIPYYNIDFTAGTAAVFNDQPETPDYFIDISPLNDCDKALPIFGDSMYPIYQNGDIILCKEVIDKSVIPLGEAFLIVTKEHRMLKYLKKGPRAGVLLAVSENKEHYDPFEIPVDKILKLFMVKGVIKRKVI